MRSVFIALFLTAFVLSGCSDNVYPTTSIAEQLPINKINKIIEYEVRNNISYKGFVGCDNFYDLYNRLNNEISKMKPTDKALLTKITYRDCVEAAMLYAQNLDSMDLYSALDATQKEYPITYCFLMGGDWQGLLLKGSY